MQTWDKQPLNPLKRQQLQILTHIATTCWRRHSRILDLGCGTGKTAELLLSHLPDARLTGVDRSPAMLQLAQERLRPFAKRVRLVCHDLNQVDKLTTQRRFRLITCVDVIHELSSPAQLAILRFCRNHLTHNGLLMVIDRIALDTARLASPLQGLLKYLQTQTGCRDGQLASNVTAPNYQDKENPLSLDQYLLRFRQAGLASACLHLYLHKALFVARSLT